MREIGRQGQVAPVVVAGPFRSQLERTTAPAILA
jgi:hypothetical protein